MKHWPSQLFPVTVLALLAGLTFWLQNIVDQGAAKSKGDPEHEPDAYAENIVVRRFDDAGKLKYRLSSPRVVHYADDDSSEFSKPVIETLGSRTPITLTANSGKASAKGEIVYLWDSVRIVRPAFENHPELVATTDDMTANTETGLAFTNSPVEIREGNSLLIGRGADIDYNASTFALRSNVKGRYIRPGTPP